MEVYATGMCEGLATGMYEGLATGMCEGLPIGICKSISIFNIPLSLRELSLRFDAAKTSTLWSSLAESQQVVLEIKPGIHTNQLQAG